MIIKMISEDGYAKVELDKNMECDVTIYNKEIEILKSYHSSEYIYTIQELDLQGYREIRRPLDLSKEIVNLTGTTFYIFSDGETQEFPPTTKGTVNDNFPAVDDTKEFIVCPVSPYARIDQGGLHCVPTNGRFGDMYAYIMIGDNEHKLEEISKKYTPIRLEQIRLERLDRLKRGVCYWCGHKVEVNGDKTCGDCVDREDPLARDEEIVMRESWSSDETLSMLKRLTTKKLKLCYLKTCYDSVVLRGKRGMLTDDEETLLLEPIIVLSKYIENME